MTKTEVYDIKPKPIEERIKLQLIKSARTKDFWIGILVSTTLIILYLICSMLLELLGVIR